MRIGIIGAGNIGGTLTRRLTSLGHEVAVANSRGPQSLADLAAETAARAVAVSETAALRCVAAPSPRAGHPDGRVCPQSTRTQSSCRLMGTAQGFGRAGQGAGT